MVSHGGVINALEHRCGEAWQRLTNLEARWFEFDDSGALLPIGDRVHLLPTDAPVVETDARYA